MSTKTHVPLPGSERTMPPDAQAIGAVDPTERIEVTVLLRPRAEPPAPAGALSAVLPHERQYLSRAELAATTAIPA